MKRIGISVVNYKTGALVVNLIDSIFNEFSAQFEFNVVVVDNQSADDSLAVIRQHIELKHYQSWVTLIAAPRNGGFSYGNNLAFKSLLDQPCDYVWMLNPDTRVLPGAAENLIRGLESDEKNGLAGSFLQDEDGEGQIASFNFPTPFGEFVNTCEVDIIKRSFPSRVIAVPISETRATADWVAGASIMIRPEVLTRVGLMDEAYFLYFEEVDYCLTALRSGFNVIFEPSSKVIHHVGASTGISDLRKKAPRRPSYWFDSRRRFFQKNYGFAAALFADLMWVLGYVMFRVKLVLKRQADIGPPVFLRDFISHSSWLKGRIKDDG